MSGTKHSTSFPFPLLKFRLTNFHKIYILQSSIIDLQGDGADIPLTKLSRVVALPHLYCDHRMAEDDDNAKFLAYRVARRRPTRHQSALPFLVTLLCSCLSFGSQAQAATKPQAQAPTATIVEFGIYKVVQKGIEYEHKESTAGYAEQGGEVAFVKRTTEIPLEKGIVFGFDWEAQGLPSIPIKIIYRVKHPRTVKPDATVSTGFDEKLRVEPKEGKIQTRTDCYMLGEDWKMLPGEWTLSVVYEGRVLCEKVFQIIAP